MENNGPPANETDSPGDRLSRLSAASLRINESLNIDTDLLAVLTIGQAQGKQPFSDERFLGEGLTHPKENPRCVSGGLAAQSNGRGERPITPLPGT